MYSNALASTSSVTSDKIQLLLLNPFKPTWMFRGRLCIRNRTGGVSATLSLSLSLSLFLSLFDRYIYLFYDTTRCNQTHLETQVKQGENWNRIQRDATLGCRLCSAAQLQSHFACPSSARNSCIDGNGSGNKNVSYMESTALDTRLPILFYRLLLFIFYFPYSPTLD